MTDDELIKGCLKDDRRCQNALYKKYFPLMSNIAYRYSSSKDHALQGINSGFLKVLNGLPGYHGNSSLATFIRSILIHHLIDEFRKQKRYTEQMHFTDNMEVDGHITWNEGEGNLETAELLELLNLLPAVTSKVFNLFAIDGYKHHEIAELLQISESTSKWHVSEARKKLKELILVLYNKEKKNKIALSAVV